MTGYRGDYNDVDEMTRWDCRGTGHPRRGLGRVIDTRGLVAVKEHCLECGDILSGALPQRGLEVDTLPLIKDNRWRPGTCAHAQTEDSWFTALDGRLSWWEKCVGCGVKLKQLSQPPPGGYLAHDGEDRRRDAAGELVVEPCARCGSLDGTQLHHWAPRALFDDADDWPVAFLCLKHHQQWHTAVTPYLRRGQKPKSEPA